MPHVSSDVAYEYIRKRILNGEFPMGDQLKSSVLSKTIGVSRTPVRDALRQLEADGLVELEPHYSAVVKLLDINDFKEICLMRMSLESLMAGLAAESRTELDLRELETALSRLEAVMDDVLVGNEAHGNEVYPDMRRCDIQFHICVFNTARKPLIKKEILRLHLVNRVIDLDDLFTTNTWTMRLSDLRRAKKSHRAIYTAIRQGHPAAAREAMTRHVQDVLDDIEHRGEVIAPNRNRRRMTAEERLLSE